MTVALSDVGRELFEQLTARTLYVVDTEFATHEGEHHLISIGIVPVIGGRRTRVRDELYRVMNPGVPIDPDTSRIHGFTDADVARKGTFDRHAATILERLRDDDAVFVCHNTIDAHILRRELERLDQRKADGDASVSIGLADLPLMPVLDTQRLAYTTGLPGTRRGEKVSLARLCSLTGVNRDTPAHNAQSDARATADALIHLLRYSAEHSVFWTLDALLEAADGGTTHDPKGPSHITGRRRRAVELPPEHVAKHIEPLTDPVADNSDEAERWLDMAAECAQLRCPYLRDEAVAAAPANGAVLLRPLMADLPHLTEPGQAGTLLGAVLELLATDGAENTLPARRALKWWAVAKGHVAASPGCDRDSADTACPACRDGDPCPRDVLYIPVARIAACAGQPGMTDQQARRIVDHSAKSPLRTWRVHHLDVLAYALWLVARYLFDAGFDERAYNAVDQGSAMGLDAVEPRLAELSCERKVEQGNADDAFTLAKAVLAQRTTDTAYDDLADWVLFTENALYAQQPAPRKAITHPRRARPEGHTNPRKYS